MTDPSLIPAPPDGTGTEWNNCLDRYSCALEAVARNKHKESLGEHYKIRDAYRHAADLIEDTRFTRDTEMLLTYSDWLLKVDNLVAVRSAVEVLRNHNSGPVRHLVTAYRIDACKRICDAISNRGGTNWEQNRECAYLAFDDPEMFDKVLMAAEAGVRGRDKILERIKLLDGIAPAIISGVL